MARTKANSLGQEDTYRHNTDHMNLNIATLSYQGDCVFVGTMAMLALMGVHSSCLENVLTGLLASVFRM